MAVGPGCSDVCEGVGGQGVQWETDTGPASNAHW